MSGEPAWELLVASAPDAEGPRYAIRSGQQLVVGSGLGADVRIEADALASEHLVGTWHPEGLQLTLAEGASGTLDGEALTADTPRLGGAGAQVSLGDPGEHSLWILALEPDAMAAQAAFVEGLAALADGDQRGGLLALERAVALGPELAPAWHQLGLVRAEQERLGDAIDALSRAIELDDELATAWHVRGVARLAQDDLAGALGDFDRALEEDPQLAPAWCDRGLARLKRRDIAGARADLDQALQVDPQLGQAWLGRARVRARQRDLGGALEDLNRAVEVGPELAEAWCDRAMAHRARGDLQAAGADAARAVELDDHLAQGWKVLGEARLDAGELEEAGAAYDRALELDARSGEAWTGRGLVRLAQGDLESAGGALDRALELGRRQPKAWLGRARVRRAQGRLSEALQDLNRGLKLSPRLGKAWLEKGELLVELGELSDAGEPVERALQLLPTQAAPYLLRARLLCAQDDGMSAVSDLNRALELDPQCARAWSQRGALRQADGEYEAALADLNRALELDPDLGEALRERAALRQGRGDLDQALTDLDRALELDPQAIDLWLNRGRIRRSQGDAVRALENLVRALELDPRRAEVWRESAELRRELGDEEGAALDLERVRELEPPPAPAPAPQPAPVSPSEEPTDFASRQRRSRAYFQDLYGGSGEEVAPTRVGPAGSGIEIPSAEEPEEEQEPEAGDEVDAPEMVLSEDQTRAYRVGKLLGRGGQGAVFEVEVHGDQEFEGFSRPVAKAVLKLGEDKEALLREQVVYSSPDRGIIKLLDVGAADTNRFLILERLYPHPFQRFPKGDERFPCDPACAVDTFVNLLDTLHRVHRRKPMPIVLCDIKPDNIMLRMSGKTGGPKNDADYLRRIASGAYEPVFMDIGCAQHRDALRQAKGRLNEMLGTPMYLPPESVPLLEDGRFTPGRYSLRTDVYALTLSFYEYLTGDRPYAHKGLYDLRGKDFLLELLDLKRDRVSPINPKVFNDRFGSEGKDVLDLIKAGLRADPDRRASTHDLLKRTKEVFRVKDNIVREVGEYRYDSVKGLRFAQTRFPPLDPHRNLYLEPVLRRVRVHSLKTTRRTRRPIL